MDWKVGEAKGKTQAKDEGCADPKTHRACRGGGHSSRHNAPPKEGGGKRRERTGARRMFQPLYTSGKTLKGGRGESGTGGKRRRGKKTRPRPLCCRSRIARHLGGGEEEGGRLRIRRRGLVLQVKEGVWKSFGKAGRIGKCRRTSWGVRFFQEHQYGKSRIGVKD